MCLLTNILIRYMDCFHLSEGVAVILELDVPDVCFICDGPDVSSIGDGVVVAIIGLHARSPGDYLLLSD